MPASQNWNFGIQHELGKDFVFELDYVGSHATRVIRVLDAVPPDPVLVQQAIAACVAARTAGNPSGCAPGDPQGAISNGVLYTGLFDPSGNPIAPPAIRETALQSAGFFPPTNITKINADAKYNSLQAKVAKPMSHGLQLGADYTWEHATDNSNDPLTPESGAGSFPVDSRNPNVIAHGNSDNDIRHRVVVSFT